MAWDAREPTLWVDHAIYGTTEAELLYRIIRSEHSRPEDFRSAFDLAHPPPRRVQLESAPLWMALSMLGSLEAAESRARLMPKLGSHVAEVHIDPGHGFAFAETIQPGHFSVWGDPFKLDARVIRVYSVA